MPNLDYIWSVNEQKLTPMKRWRLRATKRLVIVVESITKNNLMSYASALTYSSILAAVPVLAIVFAVARGFGFAHRRQAEGIAPGGSADNGHRAAVRRFVPRAYAQRRVHRCGHHLPAIHSALPDKQCGDGLQPRALLRNNAAI